MPRSPLIVLLLLAVIAGCQSQEPTRPPGTQPTTADPSAAGLLEAAGYRVTPVNQPRDPADGLMQELELTPPGGPDDLVVILDHYDSIHGARQGATRLLARSAIDLADGCGSRLVALERRSSIDPDLADRTTQAVFAILDDLDRVDQEGAKESPCEPFMVIE